MQKMFLFLLFVVVFCAPAFADQVTLTTYYPAPFGMYQEMRVMGKLGVATTAPAADLDVNGSIFFTGGSGDVNGDNFLNAADAQLIANYIAGLVSLTREQLAKADVDGNGIVTQEDANIALAMFTGFSRAQYEREVHNASYEAQDSSDGRKLVVNDKLYINSTGPSSSRLLVNDAGAVNTDSNVPLGIFQTGTKDKTALALVSTNAAGVALPSINNTALYASGTDYAGYFANGKIYSYGNVGIGTTNPATRLTVDDGTGVFSSAGGTPLALIMTGTSNVPGLAVVSTNSAGVSMPDYGNTAIYGYGTMYGGHFQGVYGGILGEGETVGLAGNSSAGNGVYGTGPQSGVVGHGLKGVEGTFSQATGYGVYGHNANGVTGGTGVYGYAWGGTGVKGEVGGAGTNYAGDFIGNVRGSTHIYAGNDKPTISLAVTTVDAASNTCQEVCTAANLTCFTSFTMESAGGHNRTAAWYDCTTPYGSVVGTVRCLCY